MGNVFQRQHFYDVVKDNQSPLHSLLAFYVRRLRNAWRHTCSFYEARVGIICDQGNRQLSKIEFEGPGDDVDVLIRI